MQFFLLSQHQPIIVASVYFVKSILSPFLISFFAQVALSRAQKMFKQD
jgi:predicted PurR-regulated permease PerM